MHRHVVAVEHVDDDWLPSAHLHRLLAEDASAARIDQWGRCAWPAVLVAGDKRNSGTPGNLCHDDQLEGEFRMLRWSLFWEAVSIARYSRSAGSNGGPPNGHLSTGARARRSGSPARNGVTTGHWSRVRREGEPPSFEVHCCARMICVHHVRKLPCNTNWNGPRHLGDVTIDGNGFELSNARSSAM